MRRARGWSLAGRPPGRGATFKIQNSPPDVSPAPMQNLNARATRSCQKLSEAKWTKSMSERQENTTHIGYGTQSRHSTTKATNPNRTQSTAKPLNENSFTSGDP